VAGFGEIGREDELSRKWMLGGRVECGHGYYDIGPGQKCR
jgi:hypothetical protein